MPVEAPSAAVRKAWEEYLRATRGIHGVAYGEVEPWAWSRLQARLTRLRQTRERVMA